MSKNKRQTIDELTAEDYWRSWRNLHNYVSFLLDEDSITLKTYEKMIDNLMDVKQCLPDEQYGPEIVEADDE